MADRWTCVDLFCGAGGLSLGLETAGLDVRVAYDIDRLSVDTYLHNMGPRVYQADVQDLSGYSLRAAAGLGSKERLDLLAGGPPCQGFSKQRRGAHLGDKRNMLVLEFLRLVEEMQPRAFLLENVSQFAQVRGRH